jgi:pimeloyl-ACP methyl ester carboxylesterase
MSVVSTPEHQSVDSGGRRIDADFYTPDTVDPPWPTVVLAHVFGAPRAWGLARFAERFAAEGFAAVVFDYRHVGTSEGTPRRLVNPWGQLEDWRAVLDHVRSLETVDASRIAIWGTSFSGGHVLAIARETPDLLAVVSMVPFVDGRAVMAHQTAHLTWSERLRTLGAAVLDRATGFIGAGPIERPIVSEPHGGGLVDTPGAREGFLSLVPPDTTVVNRMPARVVLDLPRYRPGIQPEDIDVPVHVVIAQDDRLLPLEPMETLLDRLPDARVNRVETGHFGVHTPPFFEPVVEKQVRFLTTALDSRR